KSLEPILLLQEVVEPYPRKRKLLVVERGLLRDVRLPAVDAADLGLQLPALEVELEAVDIPDDGAGIQDIAFAHVQCANNAGGFRRHEDLVRLEGAAGIVYMGVPASRQECGQDQSRPCGLSDCLRHFVFSIHCPSPLRGYTSPRGAAPREWHIAGAPGTRPRHT